MLTERNTTGLRVTHRRVVRQLGSKRDRWGGSHDTDRMEERQMKWQRRTDHWLERQTGQRDQHQAREIDTRSESWIG